jgi:glycerate dehydrogenase
MRIVVLDGHTLNPGDNPWTDVEALGELEVYERTGPDEVVARAERAEIVLTNKTPLTEEAFAALPRLRFVSVLATGYNVVDVDAARRRGIPVSNVPVYGTDSVAQFVFALLLELCHHAARHSELVHEGEWEKRKDFCFRAAPLIELAGKRMGIIGFGRIGRRVGELAHAFGMAVCAYDPCPGETPAYRPFEWKSIEEVFEEADVLSLHCPQTPGNQGMVDARLLGLMKPESVLINAARGGLVNEAHLAAALNEGRIAGAAVDVVSQEPIRAENPLLTAKNCLITPHIAWATLAARRRLMRVTADNIAAFINGHPINLVT